MARSGGDSVVVEVSIDECLIVARFALVANQIVVFGSLLV